MQVTTVIIYEYEATSSNYIDTVRDLVIWSRFLNTLEPWNNVYIIEQQQNTLILTCLTDSNFLG